MEFFNNAKLIRLRSLNNKYLFADEDQESVRQSRNGSSSLARWTVELVHGHAHLIRLKSAHGLYLTVTDEPVLLSGRKVIQCKFSARGVLDNPTVQWEPIKEGLYVKLRCKAGGKFLRGNGGAPPWRNTVSYDMPPHRAGAQDWVLWGVDVVDILQIEGSTSLMQSGSSSRLSSVSSCGGDDDDASTERGFVPPGSPAVSDESGTPRMILSMSPMRAFRRNKHHGGSSSSLDMGSGPSSPSMAARATSMFQKTFKNSSKAIGDTGSPGKASSSGSFSVKNTFKRKQDHQLVGDTSSTSTSSILCESISYEGNLELFHNAKTVRLRSQNNKYLLAKDDEETVHQGRQGSSKSARWHVEFVEGANMIRLRSCYEKYLTATEETFLMGMTGKKVLQTSPEKLDSSVQWEPFREGMQVKLKTRYGNFLRANRGPPPWRNTITHDIPKRTAMQDWILWDVEIMEIVPKHDVEEPENVDDEESEYESEKAVSRSNSTVSENDLPYSSESESEPNPMPARNTSKMQISNSFQDEGRVIYYSVAENYMDADDIIEGPSINFKGNGVEKLKEILAHKTGIRDFELCLRNAFNGQLYPITVKLLPPNKASMHVFLVPTSSSQS